MGEYLSDIMDLIVENLFYTRVTPTDKPKWKDAIKEISSAVQ